jgi:hypothetical protein
VAGYAPINAKKMSDMDPNFQSQLQAQKDQGQAEMNQRTAAGQVPWNMPSPLGDWDGDLFDEGFATIGRPFNRDQANQQYIDATSDGSNPGRSGDLVATTTQVDLMATLERAFRARHCSRFPRMVAHAMGTRGYGHGGDKGVLNQSMINYVMGILKQTGQ